MLTIFSNEVDIEMSDQDPPTCTDYKVEDNDNEYKIDSHSEEENYEIFSSGNDLQSKQSETLLMNSELYSYYDRRNVTKEYRERCSENDSFDANELHEILQDIDYTGDKIDSDDSTKTNLGSQYAFEQALRLSQLRREIVCNSKQDYQHKLLSKSTTSSNFNSKIQTCVKSPKKYLSPQTTIRPKAIYKVSKKKEIPDLDSITLLIKVPKNKLMTHFKNKVVIDSWKSDSSKSSSCESLSSSSSEKDSVTLKGDNIDFHNKELKSFSDSDITSIIDRSKEIIQNCKETMKRSNRNRQTILPKCIPLLNNNDKITQTSDLKMEQSTYSNGNTENKNYFLCNYCHKIVPANLSPICLQLTCGAIKKCSHIFHGELDMIMHLPVKHANEFASYNICSKCNRMYHPSNIVTIKGRFTCLDCVASLVQLTIDK